MERNTIHLFAKRSMSRRQVACEPLGKEGQFEQAPTTQLGGAHPSGSSPQGSALSAM